jgi:hypothetical protein
MIQRCKTTDISLLKPLISDWQRAANSQCVVFCHSFFIVGCIYQKTLISIPSTMFPIF